MGGGTNSFELLWEAARGASEACRTNGCPYCTLGVFHQLSSVGYTEQRQAQLAKRAKRIITDDAADWHQKDIFVAQAQARNPPQKRGPKLKPKPLQPAAIICPQQKIPAPARAAFEGGTSTGDHCCWPTPSSRQSTRKAAFARLFDSLKRLGPACSRASATAQCRAGSTRRRQPTATIC